jgi:multimeric flavodoxin WrbA
MWAPSLLPQKKLTRRRTAKQPVIAVAFYSTWGHVGTLAESVIKGVEATGAIVKPYQLYAEPLH